MFDLAKVYAGCPSRPKMGVQFMTGNTGTGSTLACLGLVAVLIGDIYIFTFYPSHYCILSFVQHVMIPEAMAQRDLTYEMPACFYSSTNI